MKKLFVLLCAVLVLQSCATVPAWQRAWLEDPDMRFGKDFSGSQHESNLSYREGAAGASGAHSGGGCGCN